MQPLARHQLLSYSYVGCSLCPQFIAGGSVQYLLQDGIHQDRVLLLSQTHSTDLLGGAFQAKHIFINSAIIEISACCYLCHLHESKGKFSIHSGVRGSRTFCKLYTAGQMSCGTWGCEFVLTQPAVRLLPKPASNVQVVNRGRRWCWSTGFGRLNISNC